MTYYRFRQNNSGGSFTFDAARGISVEVWIEAVDETSAIARAEEIGLYWDGCDSGRDCHCCGDRWYQYPDVEPEAPSAVESFMCWSSHKGVTDVAEGYVHHLDGTIEPLSYRDISRHP